MKRRGALLGIVLSTSWLGCNAILDNKDAFFAEEDDASGPRPDGTSPDGNPNTGDGNVNNRDGSPNADGPLNDTSQPGDTSTQDNNVPDNNVADNSVPDNNVPDNNVPDNNVPDTNPPVDPNCPGCTTLATPGAAGTWTPRAMAINGASVYYAVRPFGGSFDQIWKVPRNGGAGATRLTELPTSAEITALATDGTNVYFALTKGAGGWQINFVSAASVSSQQTYSSTSAGTARVSSLQLHNGNLYWGFTTNHYTCSVPTCAATPNFFNAGAAEARGVTFDATSIYFGFASDTPIKRCTTLPPTNNDCNIGGEFIQDKITVGEIFYRSGKLYWSNGNATALTSIVTADAGQNELASVIVNPPSGEITSMDMATDPAFVFYTTQGGVAQQAQAVTGGAVATLASSLGGNPKLKVHPTADEVFILGSSKLVRRSKN